MAIRIPDNMIDIVCVQVLIFNLQRAHGHFCEPQMYKGAHPVPNPTFDPHTGSRPGLAHGCRISDACMAQSHSESLMSHQGPDKSNCDQTRLHSLCHCNTGCNRKAAQEKKQVPGPTHHGRFRRCSLRHKSQLHFQAQVATSTAEVVQMSEN